MPKSSDPIEILFQEILAKTKANKQGKGYCPAHQDKKPSFSISRGTDGRILMKCHTGCTIDAICTSLNITQADLFPAKPQANPKYVLDKVYDYKDESGNLLFQAVRKRLTNAHECPDADPKQFRQRRPNGSGRWEWNLNGVRRVPYRLPELLAALAAHPDATVFIPEGEKDVDRLWAEGLTATCNPMGAGKWDDDYSEFLRDREAVILTDNDDPGRLHAHAVAQSLHGVASSVKVMALDGLPEKGDVSDWLNAGRTVDELCAMSLDAPEWAPHVAPITNDDDDSPEWELPVPFFEFDPPEFPIDALPGWLRSFDEKLAEATQTPPDLAANLSLAVCGATVARNVRIEARKGWQEPLNIYSLNVLESGNRKSAVVEEVTQPLFDRQWELILDKRDAIAEAQSEYRTLAGELGELEKRAAKAIDAKERDKINQERKAKARELAAKKMPVNPKLTIDDATSEVIPTILADQGGRIAIFGAEGGVFENAGGRYTNGASNIDVFLKGHSGEELQVDRRDRSEHIKRPALSIGLAVQPDVLRGLKDKPGFQGRGLTARILYTMPVSIVGRRKIRPDPVPDETRQAYSENIKRLAKIEPATNNDGETIPRMIRLSKTADDDLEKFEKEIEPRLGADGDLHSVKDWGSKLSGAVVRLAGILHLAKHAESFKDAVNLNGHWPVEVSAETLQDAIKIGRYLIPHAQAAYAEMGADPKIEDAKFLLRWIKKSGLTEFTKRDAYQGTKGRFKQVTTLEPALKTLEDHGYIRAVDAQTPNRPGRRPSEKYEVNPLMCRT